MSVSELWNMSYGVKCIDELFAMNLPIMRLVVRNQVFASVVASGWEKKKKTGKPYPPKTELNDFLSGE